MKKPLSSPPQKKKKKKEKGWGVGGRPSFIECRGWKSSEHAATEGQPDRQTDRQTDIGS